MCYPSTQARINLGKRPLPPPCPAVHLAGFPLRYSSRIHALTRSIGSPGAVGGAQEIEVPSVAAHPGAPRGKVTYTSPSGLCHSEIPRAWSRPAGLRRRGSRHGPSAAPDRSLAPRTATASLSSSGSTPLRRASLGLAVPGLVPETTSFDRPAGSQSHPAGRRRAQVTTAEGRPCGATRGPRREQRMLSPSEAEGSPRGPGAPAQRLGPGGAHGRLRRKRVRRRPAKGRSDRTIHG
jgi:hypothetical protein